VRTASFFTLRRWLENTGKARVRGRRERIFVRRLKIG
jgi:hypothetical protein